MIITDIQFTKILTKRWSELWISQCCSHITGECNLCEWVYIVGKPKRKLHQRMSDFINDVSNIVY